MEHRKAELHEVGPCDAPGNDPARFLRELRQLRTGAGLGHAELAARAHYPCDVIRAAEVGPSLPSLPVLSAYVRGCGGTAAEWEERWRSLTMSSALPLLPTRPAGGSESATAGARAGATTPVADGHDPALVMAALGRVADSMAAEPSSYSSSPSGAVADSGTAGAGARSPDPAPSPGATLPGWAASGAASPLSGLPVPPSGAASSPGAASPSGIGLSAMHAGRPTMAAHSPDTAAPLTAVAAVAATAQPPQGAFPASATGQAAGSRRLLPSRIVLAVLVAVVLCLVVSVLALVA